MFILDKDTTYKSGCSPQNNAQNTWKTIAKRKTFGKRSENNRSFQMRTGTVKFLLLLLCGAQSPYLRETKHGKDEINAKTGIGGGQKILLEFRYFEHDQQSSI